MGKASPYLCLIITVIYGKFLAKWLSVHLRTKWFWVRVQLQSLDAECMTKKGIKVFHKLMQKISLKVSGNGLLFSFLRFLDTFQPFGWLF